MPGGLHQQTPGVLVAGLGDMAAVALLAGGVLRRGEPEEAHQQARVAETAEVADLAEQPRAVWVLTPGSNTAGRPPQPGLAAGDILEFVVEGGKLRVEAVEVGAHVLKRPVCEGVIQPLSTHPRLVGLGPTALPFSDTRP